MIANSNREAHVEGARIPRCHSVLPACALFSLRRLCNASVECARIMDD
jgi:hypothetical protein